MLLISATVVSVAGMLDAGRLQSGRFQRGAGNELLPWVAKTPWNVGWWRCRCPASARWTGVRVVDVLHEGAFDGVRSVEHEGPVWGGSEARIETGLEPPTARFAR